MAKVTLDVFTAYMRSNNEAAWRVDQLQAALDAADQAIDHELQRAIALAPAATTSTRVFRPESCEADRLSIDDCVAITSVTENGTVLVANTDYVAEPLNQRSVSGETRPYSTLARVYRYWYSDGPKSTVSIVARWGWATIPAPIAEACKILAKDIATAASMRGDAAGFGDFGLVRLRNSPHVMGLIAPYRRAESWGLS